MSADEDLNRRLRLVWLRDLVVEAERQAAPLETAGTPAERLALAVSAEIDAWMRRRGATQRSLGPGRRTLARALAGQTITTDTIAEIADRLECDVVVTFQPRALVPYVAPSGDRNGTTACDNGGPHRMVEHDAPTDRTPAAAPGAGERVDDGSHA